jgi:hypothetical protein
MPTPTDKAIQALRANPASAAQFDEVFGAGAAAQYLQPEQGAAPAAAPAPAQEEQPGVMDVVIDTARGVPAGIVDAFQNAGDLLTQASDSLGIPTIIATGEDASNGIIELQTSAEAKARGTGGDVLFGQTGDDDDAVGDAQYMPGKLTQGVSQFITSFIGAGKITAPIKALQGGGYALAAGRGAVNSALGSFVGFDPQEDRLSNLLVEFPALRNPVTEYLAADENDGEIEGRFKNALEDLSLGALAEPLIVTVRALRSARKAATPEEAEAILKEAAPEVEKQLDLFENPPAAPAEVAPKAAATDPIEKAAEVALKNREAKGIAPEKPPVDPSVVQRDLDRFAFAKGMGTLDISVGREAFNYEKFTSPEAAQDAIAVVTSAVDKHIDTLSRNGTYSFEQMTKDAAEDIASITDLGADAIIANVTKVAQTSRDAAKHLIAGKTLMNSMGRDIADLARVIREDPTVATDAQRARLVQMVGQFQNLVSGVKAVQRESARVTAAGRIETGAGVTKADLDTALTIDGLARGDFDRLVDLLSATAGNPRATAKVLAKSSFGRRVADVTQEYFVNSILSGPKTFEINLISNAMNTVVMPAEKLVGAALSADKQGMIEAGRIYVGLAKGFRDAMRMAGQSFRAGGQILDAGESALDSTNYAPAIFSQRNTALGRGINLTGSIVRLPTRALGATDEFFKQLNFRAMVYARVAGEAAVKFPNDAAARARFIAEEADKAIDASGRANARVSATAKDALDYAREAAFQTPLAPGTWGHSLQMLKTKHRALGFIMPFVKTPTNIFRAAWARTPGLNLLQTKFREDLLAGGRRRQDAMGKMTSGLMITGTAASMAAEGRITGAGPLDKEQRQMLMETGWRPFSIVTINEDGTKQYTPYNRYAPLSLLLGTVATAWELYASGGMTDDEWGDIAISVAQGVKESLGDQTYMTGITNTLEAANDPSRYGEKWLEQIAAGFVPTGAQQIGRAFGGDPYLREVNGALEAMKAKVPGLSADLPPKRSWITGKPRSYDEGIWGIPGSIAPLNQSTRKGDPVLEELVNLGYEKRAPLKKLGSIELDPKQYDRYLELHGTVKIGGMTMYQRIEKTMQRGDYDLDRKRYPDAPADYKEEGRRYKMIDKIVLMYREKAKAELVREMPELAGALAEERKAVAASRSTSRERIEALLNSNQ